MSLLLQENRRLLVPALIWGLFGIVFLTIMTIIAIVASVPKMAALVAITGVPVLGKREPFRVAVFLSGLVGVDRTGGHTSRARVFFRAADPRLARSHGPPWLQCCPCTSGCTS